MSEPLTSGGGDVDLLLFQVGERVYGVDATQVLRVDKRDPQVPPVEALGALARGSRALVTRLQGVEHQLPVDAVRGVKRASVEALRRRPLGAQAHPCAVGFWLDGDTPVVLVDLWTAVTPQGRS